MTNPFFEKYTTPHETAPFDKIKLEHFEPAFMEGMKREKEEIDLIINNPESPTFDNTIIATQLADKEDYFSLSDKVSTVFFNLLSTETNDDMEELSQKMQAVWFDMSAGRLPRMESRARRAPDGLHAVGARSAGNPPREPPARRARHFKRGVKASWLVE